MTKKITSVERIVLAAWFARSNMGQKAPDQLTVQKILTEERKYPLTLKSAVEQFCGDLMETDEHEKIFQAEGVQWFRTFSPNGTRNTREAIIEAWPHIENVFWPKEA